MTTNVLQVRLWRKYAQCPHRLSHIFEHSEDFEGGRVTLRSCVWVELKKAAHPAEIGLSEARSFST